MSDTKAIDRVLKALGQIEPDPHLEQRIARRLKERSEQASQSSPVAVSPAWLRTISAGGGRFVALIAGTAIAIMLFSVEARHYKAMQRQNPARVSPPAFTPSPRASGEELQLSSTPVQAEIVVRSRQGRLPYRHRPSAENETAALELAQAPSMLAPQMPLTAQERLLLRVARRGRPETYALLNPAARAQSEVQDRNSFLAFFEPPRPPGPVK